MGTSHREHLNITSDCPVNVSGHLMGTSYLKKLSHLDEDLYHNFYSLWITLILVNTLMFVVGVVLNSLALYVFCHCSRSRTTPAIYTINLAVADLLVALSLPARIALYYSGGDCVACFYVHTFSYFVNMYCSILFLTSICVDRYVAVVRPPGTAGRWRSPAVAKGVSVCVWLFAVVVTYSLQISALELHSMSCHRLTVIFTLTLLEFVLPLLVIIAFTVRAACALADGRLMAQSRGCRARAVRLLVAVLVVFTVCFTPYHIREAVVYFQLGGSREQHVVAYHATITLSSLNSCLDPVVYCFVPDSFRSALRRERRMRLLEHPERSSVVNASRSLGDVGTPVTIGYSVALLTHNTLPPMEIHPFPKTTQTDNSEYQTLNKDISPN